MALPTLLEGLQAFTPDRMADLQAVMYSAGGAWRRLSPAALPADLSSEHRGG
jgi:hypothetical protein